MGNFDVKETTTKANGWDAITEIFEEIYPGQTDPKHYGTLINWKFGGNDPLEGISIYDAGDYWHFVTYGLSEIDEKESDNKDISGYGMEFTLKLKYPVQKLLLLQLINVEIHRLKARKLICLLNFQCQLGLKIT